MYFARGGITNAGQQRNYFLNAGTNDMYNVERVDLGRGPNAVLFNVGASSALGGGYSTIGKRARLDDTFTALGMTVGSWDYYRSTLDNNYVLKDNFALRTNLMWQKRNGWIDSAMDDRTGATLAATWQRKPAANNVVSNARSVITSPTRLYPSDRAFRKARRAAAHWSHVTTETGICASV